MGFTYEKVKKENLRGITLSTDDQGRFLIPKSLREVMGILARSKVELYLLDDGYYVRVPNKQGEE